MIFLLDGALLAPLLIEGAAFGAGCDPAAIETALASAERAFPSGDADAMEQSMFAVHKGLACVREPLDAALCARIHRAYALQHWLDSDPRGARLSIQAMLDADPRAELPSLIVGERHPLRAVMTEAEEIRPQWVDAPGSGWVLVDGVKTGAVPREQPYLLQPLKSDGRALGARLVERAAQDGTGLGSLPPVNTRTALRLGGLGLGLVSAGLYGAAWASHGAYHDAVLERDNVRISHTYGATNGLAIGSVVALGLGSGLTVTAQLVR